MPRSASPMPHLRFVVAVCAPSCRSPSWPRPRTPRTASRSGALYEDGPDGRYLMGGDWLFRLDSADQGLAQRFMRTTSTAGWAPDEGPQRLERRPTRRTSRWPGRSAGTARTSTCPARDKRMSWVAALRVGELPRAVLAQRQADRRQHRRLPAVRDPAPVVAAQAQRRQPARRPRRQPPPPDRLPALGRSRRRTCRPAAGGTTAGSCARSTSARSTASTSTRSSRGPSCRARRCAATVLLRTTVRNAALVVAARPRHRAASAGATSTSAARTSARTTSRRSPSASP